MKARGFVARLPWLDAILVAAFTAVIAVASNAEAHPSQVHNPGHLNQHPEVWEFLLLIVVPGLALLWRRRAPLAVYALGVTGTTIWAALGHVDGAALVIPVVGLYYVASTQPRRVAVLAGLAGLAAMWIAEGLASPFGWFGGANSVMWAEFIAAVAIGFFVSARRQWVAAMRERAERAEATREEEARQRVNAERLRIARELHDVVAHSMATINVQASAAAQLLDRDPPGAADALEAIRRTSKDALRELRVILNVLRNVDETDLAAPAPRLGQLDALVDATAQAGVATDVRVSGTPVELPASMELAAYRIVQESLANVLRHSGADHATLALSYLPNRLVVQVDDDGSADGATFVEGSGTGIIGMRERAAAFGGALEAGPRPGGGFRVRASIPLATAAAEPASTGGRAGQA